MSGFHIPGLGQAKPNESLPPLPPDVLAAAVSVGAVDTQFSTTTDQNVSKPEQNGAFLEEQHAVSMNIDEPGSPPSLTGALEAALGGLDTEAHAPEPSQIPTDEIGLQNDQGENPEWELDSSPYETSSESSSSDSSDDSGNDGYELLGVEETARLLMEAEGGSDDEADRGKGSSAAQLRTKNEIAQEILSRPDITITEEMKIEELGAIENIVDTIILIKAVTPGEYQVLDTGSALCTAERRVIGAVAETIGKVVQPMYTVYFPSVEEINELGLEIGTKVYYPVDHASYVFTEPLKNLKGSDASNLHDEEVGDDEMEFSDDEKEAEYRRALKQKKKDRWKSKNEGSTGAKASTPHPLSQEMSADGGLNYDDDEGPYKPLTRPPGLMNGPVQGETYEPISRSGNRRGGRGGDSRGKGGRGRGFGRGNYRGRGSSSRDGYSLPPQSNHSTYAAQHAATETAPPLVMPDLGFQFLGWPQVAAGQAQTPLIPPPPPPGWSPQAQSQSPAMPNSFVNPAFVAALMSQMQQQNGQQVWGGQPQPPPAGQGH